MSKFVIGIGSQRAGSTLLSRILEQCTPIFTHPVKELHYYDTLFNVRKEEVLKEFSKRQLDRLIVQDFSPKNKRQECLIRTNKLLFEKKVSDIEYIDLFRPCILDNDYLCEITPEYMILPEEGIKKMAEDIGSDAKIILMTRDPVDRFISAVKLLKSYGENEYNPETFEADLLHVIENMPTWVEQQLKLNEYSKTIHNYSKYFENILVLPFELISEDSGILKLKLEDFLQVDINEKKFESIVSLKVNNLGETAELSDNLLKLLCEINETHTLSYSKILEKFS